MFKEFSLECLVVGSSLIWKKRKISRNGHSLSLVVPLVVTRCHSLSLVVPLVVTRCTTRCHSLCHSLSLFVTWYTTRNDPPDRVKSFFTFKDKLTKMLHSRLAYKCKCGGCNATHYGKTKCHFKVRISKYFVNSHLTGKKVKINNNRLTTIQEHLLCCNYSPSIEDFSILIKVSNDFILKIMESLLIARDQPVLNKVDSALSLDLFWYNISRIRCFTRHMILIYPIVRIQLPFVQLSVLLFTSFCILSKIECMSI